MSLASRLSGIPDVGEDPDSVERIGFNQLISAMAERARGNVSAAGMADQFNLAGDEITQATALYNKLAALSNNAQRESFISELAQILHLSEMEFDDSANGNRNYGLLSDIEARIAEL